MTATVVTENRPIHPAGCTCTERIHRWADRTPACGTYAGYKRHQRANTPICDDCREAKATYDRERNNGTRMTRIHGRHDTCGTVPGYQRHRRLHERFCDDCRDAMAAQSRKRRSATTVKQAAPEWVLIEQAIARGGIAYAMRHCGQDYETVQGVLHAMDEELYEFEEEAS